MKQFQYCVQSPLGLHARTAYKIINSIGSLKCNIELENKDAAANIKDAFGLLNLNIVKGDCITVKVDGPDEEAALGILRKVISEEL